VPEIKLTKREIERAKKREGVYTLLRKPEQKAIDSLWMSHVINHLKLIRLAIGNETDWLRFKEELKRKL